MSMVRSVNTFTLKYPSKVLIKDFQFWEFLRFETHNDLMGIFVILNQLLSSAMGNMYIVILLCFIH